ncbi:hypothetical protein GYMLUDRAFT_69478 [Collybiopsis luxurians FD-317 M1]|nr:hypothetical protein GYMLUDRAFT_69478 [Collybiopsis luxurians FD-317 M1]
MPAPLPPPTLPPSPPASRSTSPVPPPPAPVQQSGKRKSEPGPDTDRTKRPRTDSSASAHRVSFAASTHYLPRSELAEDGEVSEEPVAHPGPSRATSMHTYPDSSPSTFMPIRRPKRGHQLNAHNIPALHDKYHQGGRKLKYSGDARFWSTYPTSHKEYRPIPNPPPTNSPYHTHGGMIAKLELMEALVMFVYAAWCREYGRGVVISETWLTMQAFIRWCRTKWKPEESSSDAEKAFHGLILMFNAYIYAHIITANQEMVNRTLERVTDHTRQAVGAAIAEASGHSSSLLGTKSQSTPPMLPSPASIGATSSANSTPTNRDGTPVSSDVRSASSSSTSSSANIAPSSSSSSSPPDPSIPSRFLPPQYQVRNPPPHVLSAASSVYATLSLNQLAVVGEYAYSIHQATTEMKQAEHHLNLSIMARHFPRTFARMVHSTLKSSEEHEVDFEDDDGELLWPGQCVTGEGLGWLCYMGEAMIREFGKQFDYKGLKGIVPKPEQVHREPRPRPPPAGTSSQR